MKFFFDWHKPTKQNETNIKENDTFKRIQNLIVRNCGNYEHEVTLEATSDSLCLDSLDEVELIMFIEEEFDTEINDIEWEKCDTVGDIVKLVDKIKGAE